MSSRLYSFRRNVGYGDLKAAMTALVDLCGGLRPAADRCRVGKTAIGQYCSGLPEHESSYMPVDVLLQLELAIDDPVITRMLATMQGYTLAPLPTPAEQATVLAHLADIASNAGKLMHNAAEAIADQKISRDEVATICRDIDELIMTAVTLRAGVSGHE